MIKKKIKTRKKYERKNKSPSEKIRELETQVDIERNRSIYLENKVEDLNRILKRNRGYTEELEIEIAMIREKNLNLFEAINIISRAERLRIQGNLYKDMNTVSSTTKQSLDNYFEANS